MASSLLTYTLKNLADQCGPGQRASKRLARGLALAYQEGTDGTATLTLSRRGTKPSMREVEAVVAAMWAIDWPMQEPAVHAPETVVDGKGQQHGVIRIDLVWLDTSH